MRTMPLPDSLVHKMSLFKERGHVVQYTEGLFLKASWIAVYLGQGIIPQQYDWNVDIQSDASVAQYLEKTKADIARATSNMPAHHASLAKHCDLSKGWETPPPAASMSLYG